MGKLLRIEFDDEDEKTPDVSEVVFRAMREARRRSGRSREQWVSLLSPRVSYGTVNATAAEGYEVGRNVPGADYYLAALAAGGLPLHHIVELWLDPHTSSLARWLITLLVH